MIIPIHSWEFQVGAEVIRGNLRTRQASNSRLPGIEIIDDLITSTTWRVLESIAVKLGGERLPR